MSDEMMNEVQGQGEANTDLALQDEKSMLLQKCKVMGISVSNNSSVETLRKKIAEKLSGEAAQTPDPAPMADPKEPVMPVLTKRQRIYNDAMKLVRCRITNLDPKKKDLPGEIFTVCNKYLGTVKRYIPYGELTDEGWHIPNVIYQMLKEKRFLQIRTTRTRDGREKVEQAMALEFSLEVLPPLTQAEIDKLAVAQKAAGIS